jgi:hypothetical protein
VNASIAELTPGVSANGGRPWLRWPAIWTVVVTALLIWGMHAHLEQYITPQRGVGYWLGILGGSMMLLLLVYSARKRAAWLGWLGSIPAWFEFHMVLGIAGPVLVLFHSNFHFGASNSNVALVSMLLVSGSGVIGRYLYTRLHANMDGHQDTLEQLQAVGNRLRSQTTSIAFLPDVLNYIEHVEQRLIQPPASTLGRVAHLFTGGVRSFIARRLVHRAIRAAVAKAARITPGSRSSVLLARHAGKLQVTARRYADRRLDAGRRLHEYRLYARIFSFWHVLHIPLFFMLLLAGVAHVIAVSVY